MGFDNVGTVWTPETFREYLAVLSRPGWAKAVTIHHCGEPNLAQRPMGLKVQHIINIRDFYKEKGWKSGPHLFTDDDQIFGMSSLLSPGVHAVSFNASAIGIEVLGDYDLEDPFDGRGLQCWLVATKTAAALLDWLDLETTAKTVLFHRDDPKTSKSCPGKKVKKEWLLPLIQEAREG